VLATRKTGAASRSPRNRLMEMAKEWLALAEEMEGKGIREAS